MASGRILVVAPDIDLLGSVAFALEAEGFDVTVKSELPEHSWVAAGKYDCTVLHQKALTGTPHASIAFCVKAYPLVLLAARPHSWLVQWVSEIVDMPVSGNAITVAVRQAMHIEA